MASREQFLDDYEISRLVCDTGNRKIDTAMVILDYEIQKMKKML
jgi:cytidylate kinase